MTGSGHIPGGQESGVQPCLLLWKKGHWCPFLLKMQERPGRGGEAATGRDPLAELQKKEKKETQGRGREPRATVPGKGVGLRALAVARPGSATSARPGRLLPGCRQFSGFLDAVSAATLFTATCMCTSL